MNDYEVNGRKVRVKPSVSRFTKSAHVIKQFVEKKYLEVHLK